MQTVRLAQKAPLAKHQAGIALSVDDCNLTSAKCLKCELAFTWKKGKKFPVGKAFCIVCGSKLNSTTNACAFPWIPVCTSEKQLKVAQEAFQHTKDLCSQNRRLDIIDVSYVDFLHDDREHTVQTKHRLPLDIYVEAKLLEWGLKAVTEEMFAEIRKASVCKELREAGLTYHMRAVAAIAQFVHLDMDGVSYPYMMFREDYPF